MLRPVLMAATAFCLCAGAHAADRDTYDEGSRPRVLINWQSFEDEGFPAEWKQPFTNVAINAYTRVNRVIGADVRPQFWGYTDKFDSDAGEIVISANEKHATSNRLASTFGWFPDRLKIVFHRKRGSDLTPWNWTPFWPNTGEYSMHAVMMHEMLHCLGLDHSAATKNIMGSYSWKSHFGPWSGDIDDMRANYGLRDDNRLRQFATYDGGASWMTLNNDITNFGHSAARTTHSVAVAGDDPGAAYVVGWTSPNNRLTWIRGNGVSFDADTWKIYGGGPEVMFGGAMATDDDDTYLWAFVDTTNDERRVRVIRSTDDADSWGYVSFPVARTYGRPGIATTLVNDQRAWIVVWANYDESIRADTGFIQASVSFNNGSTWTSPQRFDEFYRVHDGVSIEADAAGQCQVSFVWAGELEDWAYGQNKVRALRAHVESSGGLVRDSICTGSRHSRIAPDLAWHAGTSKFVLGMREQDFNTSLDAMSGNPTSCLTNFLHIGGSTTHVAPSLAANSVWNEVVMWFASE